VGLADTGTEFRDCYAGAEIMLDGDGVNKFHAGGFAGILTGMVRSSVTGIPYVSGAAVSFGSVPITVKTQGSGNVYGGGIAGIMMGGAITDVSSNAVILVECNSGASYAGGFAGYVQAGGITNNRSTGSLSITAHSAFTGTGEAYAGGIAGLSTQTLQSNTLEGSLTVVSKYYSNAGYAGGLAGKLSGSGVSILDCSITNAQQITAHSHDNPASSPGKAYAGGLVGYSDLAAIKKSAFKSSNAMILAGWTPVQQAVNQAAKEAYAGGLVGYTTGPVDQSYALAFQATSGYGGSIEARVTEPNDDSTVIPGPRPGSAYAGGLVGHAFNLTSGVIPTITESYAVATVKSVAAASATVLMSGAIAGGLVGQTDSNIASAFAVAEIDVRAEHNAGRAQGGGIAGIYTDTTTTIEEVYAAGNINVFVSNLPSTPRAYAGGLLGQTPNISILGVNRSVALQRYVASNADAANHHQIAGTEVLPPSGTIMNHRYENLRPQGTGTAGFAPLPLTDSTGNGDITAVQAGVGAANPIAWYTSQLWDVGLAWGYQQPPVYPFPILKRLDTPPSLPSWAQIN
jgi:hypothetical protein